ncbi:MAG: GNAT family N-acetyltransferase [Acidobacteriota bacterium]|nr:GNAT family N-acetyltransferase [Acidobacteriota bacterium]
MHVVPYSSKHVDELRSVCLASASERARADETHGAFTLAMYCDPYLEHGVAYMLVDDGGVAHGYALACEDWGHWSVSAAAYREKIEALGPEYRMRYAAEAAFYDSVRDRYPAHLHIDIEEPFTGGGNGRKLMEALLARLRADGVRGVVFGVSASNRRAIGFYEHMGFSKLSEYDEGSGYTFCMSLAEGSA